jgi:hypothetical protein
VKAQDSCVWVDEGDSCGELLCEENVGHFGGCVGVDWVVLQV